MIHLLPDDFSGHARLAEIRQGCGAPDLVALNTTQLDGQRVSLDELTAAAGAIPFLAERRLVIVRRLLAQFEPRPAEAGGERRRGARGERGQAIAERLAQVPPTTELVLLEPSVPAKGSANPVYQAVARLGGEIVESRELKPDELAAWIGQRIRAKGGRIAADAVAALAALGGADLQGTDVALDMLLTYAGAAEVTLADVRALVSEARDENVFHLVDAIGRRDRPRALALLRGILDSGAAASYLLAMIARQLRLLLQVRELMVGYVDQQQVASQLRIAPWQARNLLGQARQFGSGELERAYGRLLATDQAIKTSQLSDELALDLLVAELAGR